MTLKRFCELCTRVGVALLAAAILFVLFAVGAAGRATAAGVEVIVVVTVLYPVLLNYLLTAMLRGKKEVWVILFAIVMVPSWFCFVMFPLGILSIGNIPVLIKGVIIIASIIYCVASAYTVYSNAKTVRRP